MEWKRAKVETCWTVGSKLPFPYKTEMMHCVAYGWGCNIPFKTIPYQIYQKTQQPCAFRCWSLGGAHVSGLYCSCLCCETLYRPQLDELDRLNTNLY